MTIVNRVFILALLAGCLTAALAIAGCSSSESDAKKAIDEYLKNQGVTAVTLDLFYPDPNSQDKAYASATITYNFATAEGKPQREFLGFMLTREGNTWRVQRPMSYTKEQQRAATLLTGGK